MLLHWEAFHSSALKQEVCLCFGRGSFFLSAAQLYAQAVRFVS